MTPDASFFSEFEAALRALGPDRLHAEEIGRNLEVEGPFGPVRLLYADYVASGRALGVVEREIQTRILPFYANSHTEASLCGATMTGLRRAARAYIAAQIGAGAEHAVIFAGSGATAGINRLPHLLGLDQAMSEGRKVLVCVGPYEHHSNLLPWRESGATVVEIPEAPGGGPCEATLREELHRAGPDMLKVASFSAASNVTGALTDVVRITRLVKSLGAVSVWDYAGGGPYLEIDMTPAPDAAIDALVLSPHKCPGGPGASGLLAIRRDAVRAVTPTVPGGGTVRFVSPWGHDYATTLEAREEGGTPNVLGDLRAAMALAVKAAVGADWIAARNRALSERADDALRGMAGITHLTAGDCAHLPIVSFKVTRPDGVAVHQQLATRVLSDRFGIQARGGCACAGPYVHRLLEIDHDASDALWQRLSAGEELARPGFVRLNLSYLLSDAEVDRILSAIRDLPAAVAMLSNRYTADPDHAIFHAA